MSQEINGYLLRERLPVITLGAAGPVGAAATTVDVVSHIGVTASAANLIFTLPVPSDTRSGRDLIVTNTGVNAFTVLGMRIDSNRFGQFIWDATELAWQAPAVPLASGADLFRSGSLTGLMPDGTTDTQDAIYRSGQVVIDTAINGDGGLTLDDLRSKTSVQLSAGEAGVTDTNMTAVGVDLLGKVRLSNALAYPDLRATNPNPQDFAAGTYYAFKQSATVGLTGAGYIGIPTYVGLETTRRHAQAGDFSGGPVIQRVFLEDGRSYYRTSVSGTSWGPWNMEAGSRPALQHRWTSQAATKISIANEIRWAGFYNVMTTGTNTAEPGGHFSIHMPADGFAVPVAGGGTRAVVPAVAGSAVDTGGILLNNWDTLWYRHVYGSGQGPVPGNFLIVPYTANTSAPVNGPFTNPDDWIKIASRGDNQVFQLGNGDTLTPGSQIGRGVGVTVANWTAMKQRAMGDGYFFSPGGNTAVPTAFGFTGTIRWIDGGSTPFVNSTGYRDATQAIKVTGTAIRGVNGAANRTWRLMTAAEKPGWFGGAQRGQNPILAASSTVVDLNDNETLYFVPNIDATGASEDQWVVAGWSGFVSTPVHWLPIASRQSVGGHSTIQVLVGGLQYALKAGDATYTTTPADHYKDAKHRKVTHKGLKFCRWTQNAFFAGAGANGVPAGGNSQGVLVSWDDNQMVYGISDGYNSWGNQFSYINVPSVGAQIPVTLSNSNVTRVVQNISGRKYVPLSNWEALYWIPPAYSGGAGSVDGDFVIGFYNGNHSIPTNAVLIAKVEGTVGFPTGNTSNKTRVLFADGTYIQPGLSPVTGTPVQNDHAQGTGDWRPLVYPGQTGPGMTAAMPAVPGVLGAYAAPYTAFYNYRTVDDDPRGNIHLEGIINLNADVAASDRLAFLPGVNVRGFPIVSVLISASTLGENHAIMGQVRFQNATVNGSTGVEILAWGGSFTAANPQRTLGANGGASAAGVPQWVSLNNIILPHA